MDNLFEKFFSRPEMPFTDLESSSTIMNDVSNGIIKDPFMFDYKIHEKCPTLPLLSDEKRKTVDRFWRDAYLKSLNKVVSHVQDWFTKTSFQNKVKFTEKLIGLMVDSRKLFDVAYFIGPPTKDWVYSHTQFTRSPSDVAATDHNRALGDTMYDSQSSTYLEWFQLLNPREQFDAVVGLIHLGGTALEQNIYGQVVKILEEKERNVIRKRVLEYLAHKREVGSKFVASKVAKHKQHLHRPMRTTRQKTQPQPQLTKSEPSGDDVNYMTLLQDKIAEYDYAIKSMEKVTESHIDSKARKHSKRSRKSKSSTPVTGSKMLYRLNAGLDRVQMLPLWDNRRIIAMLPDKLSSGATKVNAYWKEMVVRTKKEMKVRKKIDKFLGKKRIEPKQIGEHKDDPQEHKKAKKTHYSIETRIRPKEEDITPEDYHEHLDPGMVFTDDPPKMKPFSNPPETYVICNQYCDDRAMDANKRWAAYSKKMDVEVCNIVFGVPTNIKLENVHKLRISCVCFHPTEGSLVFTGGHDGHVKLHDVWKKSVKMVYAGHKGIVSNVVANCRYVASCGMDKTIRVFNISDGRSMMCLKEDKLSPCRLLMTNCAFPLLYVANIHGEIIMYSVRDSGCPQNIGKPVSAHHGEVTSMNHYPCVLLTTGVDGYVRLWATNFEKPFWILSLKHFTRVNSAVMSYRKIVSASEDGKMRIWDVMSGACEKVMNITPTSRPILSMCCVQGPHSVKIVLNNEADIRVVEFLLKKAVAKKLGRVKGSKLKPIGDFQKKISPVRPIISSYDKRIMKLQMRQAVLSPIDPSHSLPCPSLLQDRQKNYELIEKE